MTSVVIRCNRYNLARRANACWKSLRNVWEDFTPYNVEVVIFLSRTRNRVDHKIIVLLTSFMNALINTKLTISQREIRTNSGRLVSTSLIFKMFDDKKLSI